MNTQNTKVLYNPIEIDDCVWGIANTINGMYPDNLAESNIVFCPILTGVVPFFADICKYVEIDPYIEYIGVSSYNGTEQQDKFNVYKLPVADNIKGRTVWLFDDIADSGLTLDFLTRTLFSMGAKEVKTCVLLKKNTCTFPVDVYGFPLENDDWIHGYGMDAPNGRGRISPALLATTL